MKETQLVRQILDFCRYRDLLFWRNQSGAVQTKTGHLVKFGSVGSPDLVGCVDGRFVGVECKVGKNTPTEAQLRFGALIEKNGGQYWVVYNLDDFINNINKLMYEKV